MHAAALLAAIADNNLDGVAGWMASLISALGSPGVGVIILLETVFPPIPSEAVLPAAGYLAAVGELGFVATLVWSTVGSVAGALVLYWIGAAVGQERIARVAQRLPLMSAGDIDRAWSVFGRWSHHGVFWGRLVPGVRSLVSIPAGAQRMPLRHFVPLTAAGSLLWNAALVTAGWWLGDRYGSTASISHWLNLALVAGVIGFVCWIAIRLIRRRPHRHIGVP